MTEQASFQIFILGKLTNGKLAILAQYQASTVLSRFAIEKASIESIHQKQQELRGFIEAGYPELKAQDLCEFGRNLFDFVFQETVRDAYYMATGTAYETMLPIELFIEDHQIAAWPWEFIFDPAQGVFPCLRRRPISRGIFVAHPGPRFDGRYEGKVCVLVVLASPFSEPRVSGEEEASLIAEAVQPHIDSEKVKLDFVEPITPQDLHRKIISNTYQVLHFAGEGGFDTGRAEGFLKLRSGVRDGVRLYANDLASMLSGRGIRLVFLNACETGRSDQTGNLDPSQSSVAGSLLRAGIPCTIATQFSMPDTGALYFASVVYDTLQKGGSVGAAVLEGRYALSYTESSRTPDWGIPVLYSSQPDLILFPQQAKIRRHTVEGLPSEKRSPVQSSSVIEKTRIWPHAQEPHTKVALVDLDAGVGFLPDLVTKANVAQDYFHFAVARLPVPSGAVRTDFKNAGPQMFLPRLKDLLSGAPDRLDVDWVCCLTCHWVAGEYDGKVFWNYMSAPLEDKRIALASTAGLREHAQKARVSFAKATLYLCLGQLIQYELGGIGMFHDETVGCLFDYCQKIDDRIKGLRHMSFDHASCRGRIRDPLLLQAIDALHALDVTSAWIV